MEQITTGLSEGDFTSLRVLDANGVMTNILVLLQNAGGGQQGQGGGNFTSQNWEDQNSTVRILQPNITGQLLYNSQMLVDMQVLQQNLANFTQTAQLTTLLAAKQDNLVAGENITISNNVISSTGGGTG